METKTNWLALVACVIAGMVMGFGWYTLFVDQWAAGNGIVIEGEKMSKNGVEMPMSMLPMVVNVISLFVYAYLMNWLINKAQSGTLMGGATIGAVIGVIHFFGIYTGNRFAGNPTSLSMVDGFFTLLLFTVFGAIIGGWRAK